AGRQQSGRFLSVGLSSGGGVALGGWIIAGDGSPCSAEVGAEHERALRMAAGSPGAEAGKWGWRQRWSGRMRGVCGAACGLGQTKSGEQRDDQTAKKAPSGRLVRCHEEDS